MFEKYDINDLFLASIDVWYPDSVVMWEINIGGVLMMADTGYGYSTILKKDGDKYIDLQNMSNNITAIRDSSRKSYVINYIEPLSKYYTQEGKKKTTVSKRKALSLANKYYNVMYQEHSKQMQDAT